MEKESNETHTPLQCPRCGSLDTKFRYYNNNSRAQPRHYCRTCERQWTVGGNMRNTPIGGKTKKHKPMGATSSKGGNQICRPPHPWISLGEEHQQNSQSPTPPMTVVSPNFATTMCQPATNFNAAVPELEPYYLNNQVSCFDRVQSVIQPKITNQHVNAGNNFLQEWNVQTMAQLQAMQQENPRNMGAYQPVSPMNPLSHDIMNDLSFTTSDNGLRNNFSANTTETEDTTSVNIDEWLNFPGDDLP